MENCVKLCTAFHTSCGSNTEGQSKSTAFAWSFTRSSGRRSQEVSPEKLQEMEDISWDTGADFKQGEVYMAINLQLKYHSQA